VGRALGFLADALGLARLLAELVALRRRPPEPGAPPAESKEKT
jgi:hypothetical protein